MTSSTTIAILGAGNVGGNLGVRLAASGFTVKFGVRPGSDTKDLLARAGANAELLTPRDAAAAADIVFIATPTSAAVQVAKDAGLVGKIVVDCTNPVAWKDGPVWAPPAEGSVAAAIAAAVPGARVVKGFNTFGAEIHLDPSLAGTPANVFLAGDDLEAKRAVAAVATAAGFAPIDSGPLRNAAVLENLAVLWIHLALREGHGRSWAFVQAKR
ncbi:MAG: NAD(P)-binding domain-containing protein [Nannocystis sp.]|uniref:NADPH-dependent F420 reductase n=1 Tax=Nannocystis sp. TaxID=1962667 RepID=UPI0024244405|nr:NAD(P)-binding domain-containing protein [Nannocystis sp.]MBK9757713.1 NAD(P)-binding domain-containing protein [Nannocystis sp.]